MEYIVDRIEDNVAVLEGEDGDMTDVKLAELPEGVKEGDVLELKEGRYRIDCARTQNRREQMEDLFRSLF